MQGLKFEYENARKRKANWQERLKQLEEAIDTESHKCEELETKLFQLGA